MKFIPGKKYMIEGHNKPSVYIGACTYGLVFENSVGWPQVHGRDNKFTEYKEPVVHTRYIHWYKYQKSTKIGAIASSEKNFPFASSYTLIKTDTVTYTEE